MKWKRLGFLGVATNIVNLMKQIPIHSRMFKCLWENVDTKHINLLLHAGIRWLSRGRVLNRVFELNGLLQDYFKNLQSALKVNNGCRNWSTLQTFFITWTEWTSLCNAPERVFSLQVSSLLDLKGKWIFGKNLLWNEILKSLDCCWGLSENEDTSKFWILLKIILNCRKN
jgi:hypothetical protein